MLSWSDAFTAGPAVAGGKGWNLARLRRYGFEVPDGGVLPAEAYRAACRTPQVAGALAAVAHVTPETAQEAEPLLARVRQAFATAPVPEDPPGPWAVRSSAVGEDGAAASFAGIHESFLDATDVPRAVRGCWASLWTPRAVAYRRRLGLSDEAVACAVVLCRMVAARSAGVAFTCDPATGRRDLVVVEAVPGLGDRLVRGEATPERVVLRRVRGLFRVESRTGEGVLPDDRALLLARLAWRVMWALGEVPQDLEWAWDGERLHLLQARPVTRLPHHTFPGVRGQPVWWSNANMKDAVPGVVSPLAWSLIQEAIPDVLYALPHAVGYDVPPGMPITRRFQGRAYFDFSGMQWGFYDSIGMTPEETVRAIGGHQPAIEVPPGHPMQGPEGRRRTLARLRMLRILWGLDRRLRRALERHFAELRTAVPEDLTTTSLANLQRMQMHLNALHDRLDPLVGLANVATGGWIQLLEAQLRAVAGAEAASLESRLLTGSGDVVSADQGYRTWELARAARCDPEARRWLASGAPGASWRELPEGPFRQDLEEFLRLYGHRAVYEADSMNPRWAEDPSYLLDQVRAFLPAEEEESPRSRAAALRRKALADLRRRCSWWRWPLVRWALHEVSTGIALREAAKSALCATVAPGRRLALELGSRLVAAGHLADREDVFFLTRPDLDALLDGEWDGRGAASLAADRRRQREEWLQHEPPDVLREDGTAWATPSQAPASAGALTGLGVASGAATGAARLLRHPHEGHRLANGEVLVAPSTDPGWTPLFLRASAIVMESGGYLSHGAIVAREFGIPAVTNVPGLLTRVRDGEVLRVDGDRGVVERVEG